MTLILGIRCDKGVVMAADSAATTGGGFVQDTIRQPVHKLKPIKERVILGVSGPEGLVQQFEGEIERLVRNPSSTSTWGSKDTVLTVQKKVRDRLWPWIKRELVRAKEAGLNPAQLVASALLATAVANTAHLIEFDPVMPEEHRTKDLPFACIGTGRNVADPFLAFLREIFFEDNVLPNLALGRFVAFWALRHAIRTAPAHVAGPMHVMVLEQIETTDSKQQWRVRELAPNELLEHLQRCDGAEDWLRAFKSELRIDETTPDVPEPSSTRASG